MHRSGSGSLGFRVRVLHVVTEEVVEFVRVPPTETSGTVRVL